MHTRPGQRFGTRRRVMVIDESGTNLGHTDKNGLVRILLRDGRARICSEDPFAIQLMSDEVVDL